ncbi:UDP-glucose 4-epimerase [Roseiarcus fermentans]|uniref:UDP-glucose 4-epimerase n=1 Tax=Roseiarcus fermentans TaxID=1473586 RepID=A0A366EJU0_9HYPH|nr:NAD(P)-dependent oxidoreductase [Roseiarcus fermentans]RBP02687.1 UDP-glucose 4-epimerase [Roseiarcus fermentans]
MTDAIRDVAASRPSGVRVLVTGAYGLIGHQTVLALRAAGFDAAPTDILSERPADAEFDASPLAIAGIEPLQAYLEAHRIQAIVHAAGISGPMLAKDRPHAVLSTNVGGALDLYEAARLASVRRIVLISSAAAYGDTGEAPVDERTPLAAADAYGVSKISSELIARAYARHGVDSVVLRPSWVYGPRRRTACVIRTMIADALRRQPTRLPYGVGFPRQFVHVEDVAEAIVAALTTPKGTQSAFNVSDGRRFPLDDVAGLICARLPEARIEMAGGPDPDDVLCGPLDISAASAVLGWRPRIGLSTGIDRMISDMSREH